MLLAAVLCQVPHVHCLPVWIRTVSSAVVAACLLQASAAAPVVHMHVIRSRGFISKPSSARRSGRVSPGPAISNALKVRSLRHALCSALPKMYCYNLALISMAL
jgi:hypothetical protein